LFFICTESYSLTKLWLSWFLGRPKSHVLPTLWMAAMERTNVWKSSQEMDREILNELDSIKHSFNVRLSKMLPYDHVSFPLKSILGSDGVLLTPVFPSASAPFSGGHALSAPANNLYASFFGLAMGLPSVCAPLGWPTTFPAADGEGDRGTPRGIQARINRRGLMLTRRRDSDFGLRGRGPVATGRGHSLRVSLRRVGRAARPRRGRRR